MARYGGMAATDAGRDAATSQLREHYAASRLSLDQFQDRLDQAYQAQTARELDMVTAGLPPVRQPISPRAPLRGHPGNAGAAQLRAALGRTARRVMLALGVLTAGGLLVLALIATALLVHGGLLADMAAALFAILAAGLAGTAALVWLARRRWLRRARTAAALPVAGPSWQSLATRAARLLLNGRALERLLARLAARA